MVRFGFLQRVAGCCFVLWHCVSLLSTASANEGPSVITFQPTAGPSRYIRSSPINFQLVWSEQVSDLMWDEIVVSGSAGAWLSAFSGSGAWYALTISISGAAPPGTVQVSIGAGSAQNSTGAQSLGFVSDVYYYDNVKPTVQIWATNGISSGDELTEDPFGIVVEFSEEVIGFDMSKVAISPAGAILSVSAPEWANGSLGLVTEAGHMGYYFQINVDEDLLDPNQQYLKITLDMYAASVMDRAQNLNTPATQFVLFYDPTPPRVTSFRLSSTDPTRQVTRTPVSVEVVWSEPISTFELTDVSWEGEFGGEVQLLSLGGGSPGTYFSVSLDVTSNGNITLSIPEGVVTDPFGNPNEAAVMQTFKFDNIKPVPRLYSNQVSHSDFTNESPVEIILEFSEPIVGMTQDAWEHLVGDFVIADYQPQPFPSTVWDIMSTEAKTTFIYQLDMTQDSTVRVGFSAGMVFDPSGNGNTPGNVYQFHYDGTRPKILELDLANGYRWATNQNPMLYRVKWSEPVNMTQDMVTIISEMSTTIVEWEPIEGNTMWLFEVQVNWPDHAKDIVVEVKEKQFQDHGRNWNMGAITRPTIYDKTPPEGWIWIEDVAHMGATQLDMIRAKINFSEPMTDFGTWRVFATEDTATLQNFTVTYNEHNESTAIGITQLEFDVNVTAEGRINIWIETGSITDLAGNRNPRVGPYWFDHDITRPRVALTSSARWLIPDHGFFTGQKMTIDAQFTEPVHGFNVSIEEFEAEKVNITIKYNKTIIPDEILALFPMSQQPLNDFEIEECNPSPFNTRMDPEVENRTLFSRYICDAELKGEGYIEVQVLENVTHDLAENWNYPTGLDNLTEPIKMWFDNVGPTPLIQMEPNKSHHNIRPTTFTIWFHEMFDLSTFRMDDIIIENATLLDPLTHRGDWVTDTNMTKFTVVVWPEDDMAQVTVGVKAGAVSDRLWNPNIKRTETYLFDRIPLYVRDAWVIHPVNGRRIPYQACVMNSVDPFWLYIEFDQEPIDFIPQQEIRLTNGTIDWRKSGINETYAVAPEERIHRYWIIPDTNASTVGDIDIHFRILGGTKPCTGARDNATNCFTQDGFNMTVYTDLTPPVMQLLYAPAAHPDDPIWGAAAGPHSTVMVGADEPVVPVVPNPFTMGPNAGITISGARNDGVRGWRELDPRRFTRPPRRMEPFDIEKDPTLVPGTAATGKPEPDEEDEGGGTGSRRRQLRYWALQQRSWRYLFDIMQPREGNMTAVIHQGAMQNLATIPNANNDSITLASRPKQDPMQWNATFFGMSMVLHDAKLEDFDLQTQYTVRRNIAYSMGWPAARVVDITFDRIYDRNEWLWYQYLLNDNLTLPEIMPSYESMFTSRGLNPPLMTDFGAARRLQKQSERASTRPADGKIDWEAVRKAAHADPSIMEARASCICEEPVSRPSDADRMHARDAPSLFEGKLRSGLTDRERQRLHRWHCCSPETRAKLAAHFREIAGLSAHSKAASAMGTSNLRGFADRPATRRALTDTDTASDDTPVNLPISLSNVATPLKPTTASVPPAGAERAAAAMVWNVEYGDAGPATVPFSWINLGVVVEFRVVTSGLDGRNPPSRDDTSTPAFLIADSLLTGDFEARLRGGVSGEPLYYGQVTLGSNVFFRDEAVPIPPNTNQEVPAGTIAGAVVGGLAGTAFLIGSIAFCFVARGSTHHMSKQAQAQSQYTAKMEQTERGASMLVQAGALAEMKNIVHHMAIQRAVVQGQDVGTLMASEQLSHEEQLQEKEDKLAEAMHVVLQERAAEDRQTKHSAMQQKPQSGDEDESGGEEGEGGGGVAGTNQVHSAMDGSSGSMTSQGDQGAHMAARPIDGMVKGGTVVDSGRGSKASGRGHGGKKDKRSQRRRRSVYSSSEESDNDSDSYSDSDSSYDSSDDSDSSYDSRYKRRGVRREQLKRRTRDRKRRRGTDRDHRSRAESSSKYKYNARKADSKKRSKAKGPKRPKAVAASAQPGVSLQDSHHEALQDIVDNHGAAFEDDDGGFTFRMSVNAAQMEDQAPPVAPTKSRGRSKSKARGHSKGKSKASSNSRV